MTMEEYIEWTLTDHCAGVVRPRIEDDATFEINCYILKELRDTLFIAKRLIKSEPMGTITTWELLKSKFLAKYCPPSKTARQIKEIHNFKQEVVEIVYKVWKGPILKITPANGKHAIQDMVDHSQMWHDGANEKRMGVENFTGLAAITT
nr:hypothetical protein [Tanacetum cinerariifolium]